MNEDYNRAPVERPVMRITPAQRRALEIADADVELQIGGADGRPIRRSVAEKLVSMGVMVRTHVPQPYENWWGYRRAPTHN